MFRSGTRRRRCLVARALPERSAVPVSARPPVPASGPIPPNGPCRAGSPATEANSEEARTPGQRIAGPAAKALLAEEPDGSALHRLRTNFLKTEPGARSLSSASGRRALRMRPHAVLFELPDEQGARPEAACQTRPRGRMIIDPEAVGWPHEVERHEATRRRISELPSGLGPERNPTAT